MTKFARVCCMVAVAVMAVGFAATSARAGDEKSCEKQAKESCKEVFVKDIKDACEKKAKEMCEVDKATGKSKK